MDWAFFVIPEGTFKIQLSSQSTISRWICQLPIQAYRLKDRIPRFPVKVHSTGSESDLLPFQHQASVSKIAKAAMWFLIKHLLGSTQWVFWPHLMPALVIRFFRWLCKPYWTHTVRCHLLVSLLVFISCVTYPSVELLLDVPVSQKNFNPWLLTIGKTGFLESFSWSSLRHTCLPPSFSLDPFLILLFHTTGTWWEWKGLYLTVLHLWFPESSLL